MAYNTHDPVSCHDAHEARRGLQPRFFTVRRAQLRPTGAAARQNVLRWPVTKKACRDSWVGTVRYA
jgi:hypothetical protein